MEKPALPPLLRTCPSCNSRIEPDHEFCEICGAKMPELPACSNCGARFIAPVKFCEMCGTPVKPPAPAGPAHEVKPEPVDQPEPPHPVKPVVKKVIAVPASMGKDVPGTADEALYSPPENPVPVKPRADRARVIGGIVLVIVVLAAAWFIALPMLTGNGGQGVFGKPVTAEITPVPDPGYAEVTRGPEGLLPGPERPGECKDIHQLCRKCGDGQHQQCRRESHPAGRCGGNRGHPAPEGGNRAHP